MARFPIVGDVIDALLATEAASENRKITQEAMERLGGMQNYNFSDEQLRPHYLDVPDDVKYSNVSIDPELRAKQMAALQQMQDISEGRIASQGSYERELARRGAEQLARQREEGVLQQAQMRGMGGSGMEFALRAQAGQNAANQAQMGGMQSAAQAALERLQSQQSYQQGLGNLRAQDTDLSARNSDIINRFNAYNADRQLNARQYNNMLPGQIQAANLARKDRNNIATTNFEANRVGAMNNMLGEQRGDVGRRYQPAFALNNAFSEQMGNMLAQGVGGDIGGQMGGQMGGGMGAMMGQQAGTQLMNQGMQQPGYNNVQPPGWGYNNGWQKPGAQIGDNAGYWI